MTYSLVVTASLAAFYHHICPRSVRTQVESAMVTNALCLKLQFVGFRGSSFESISFFHGSSSAGIVLKDRLMMAPGYCTRCHGGITWRSKEKFVISRVSKGVI